MLGIQAWLETTLAILAAVVGVLGLAMTVITFISSQVERRAEAKRQAHLEFLAAEGTRLKEAGLLTPDGKLIQTFSVQQMRDEISMQGQNVAGGRPASPSRDLLLKQRKRFWRLYGSRTRYRRGIAFMLFSAALLVVLAFV